MFDPLRTSVDGVRITFVLSSEAFATNANNNDIFRFDVHHVFQRFIWGDRMNGMVLANNIRILRIERIDQANIVIVDE